MYLVNQKVEKSGTYQSVDYFAAPSISREMVSRISLGEGMSTNYLVFEISNPSTFMTPNLFITYIERNFKTWIDGAIYRKLKDDLILAASCGKTAEEESNSTQRYFA